MPFKKSLQAIKNDIIKNEEIVKRLQKSYPHLAHLSENQLLNYFDVNTICELDGHIKQVKESQELPYDLTVQKKEICACRDSHGHLKDLYDSEVSAKAQIRQLSKEKRSQLTVYICPDGCGWHLTKT